MQNKKTVLFIMPNEDDEQALSIKKELCKDVAFTAIILSENNLRCLFRNKLFDFLFPKGSKRRNIVKETKQKMNNSPRRMFTYGESYSIPEKTFRNMIYRYLPDTIVVSTPETLYSTIYFVKKIGMNNRICVLCKDLVLRQDFVDENVDCYFVDNFDMRSALIASGIPSERIEINELPVSEEFSEDRSKETAREELGFEPNQKIIVVNTENGGAKMRRAISLFLENSTRDEKFIFLNGRDKQMNAFLMDKGATMYAGNEVGKLFAAADIVLTVPDATTVAEGQISGTKVIVFETEDVATLENYNYLVEEKGAIGATNGKEALEAIQKIVSESKTVVEVKRPEMPDSAQMIALRLQQMLLKNETEEVL